MHFDILDPDWVCVEMFVSSSSMNYVCMTKRIYNIYMKQRNKTFKINNYLYQA